MDFDSNHNFLSCFFTYHYITKAKYRSISSGTTIDKIAAHDLVEGKTITVFFVIYIVLLSLRGIMVGVDTKHYINNYFIPFRTMDWGQIVEFKSDELAFSLLSKILSTLTSNPTVYLTTIALLSVIPVLLLYKKEAKDAILCCSFFLISLLFEMFFSGLRQDIAIALTIVSFCYVKIKKPLSFVIFIILAASFHLSALIAIAIYPIYHAKITKKCLWFVVPFMALVYYYNSTIFNTLLLFSGEKYIYKYGVWGLGTTNQYGLLILFVLISIYCFFMLDEEKADADDIGFRNLLLLATLLQFFAPLHFIASRMNYYFIVYIPIALTRTNYKCKDRYYQIAKLASIVMIVYFIVYFFFMKGDSLQIADYKFFFN